MAVNIRRFTGYSSQSDRLLIDPAKASQAINLCIYKGALCNLPYPRSVGGQLESIDWGEINPERLMIFWYIEGLVYLFVYSSAGSIKIYRYNPFDGNLVASFSGLTFPIYMDLGYKIGESYSLISGINGNLLQVGSYIYLLCKLSGTTINGIPNPRPFMMKARKRPGLSNHTFRFEPIGLPEIRLAKIVTTTGAGSLNGTYDFAVTIALDHSTPSGSNTTDLDEFGIEGNAYVLNDERLYASGNHICTLRIYLESGVPLTNSVGQEFFLRLGVYVKEASQAFYYFAYYLAQFLTPAGVDEDGEYYEVTLSTISIPDLTRVAPGFGENPRREAPRLSYHAVEYKSRVYYANAESNQLEYSQIFLDDSPHKNEAQYIEGAELIGDNDDFVSGVVIYLGQLIIFKNSSTYVLTDEITQGQIRQLFNDKGCVNVPGGKAYIIVNDILYFLDKTGLYMWNGNGDPVKISKEIQEDLDQIKPQQYSYARLSIDPRYELLYLTFPRAHVLPEEQSSASSFIYHYGEVQENGIGIWTKTDPSFKLSSVILDKNINLVNQRDSIVYFNRSNKFERLAKITDSCDCFAGGRFWAWQSGILDLGDPTQEKHFKRLGLYISGFNGDDQIQIGHEFEDGKVITDIVNNVSELRLGFSVEKYLLSLGSYNDSSTRRAFRIGGYNLDVHRAGRR